MEYIVYCTANLVNNKIYIGVHKTENHKKFDGYIGCGVNINSPSSYKNPTTNFQKAVLKYGFKNFRRYILFVFDTAEEAYKKEAQIVDRDFIKLSTNYNMVPGGIHGSMEDTLYEFNTDGTLYKKWDSISDAMDYYGYTDQAFRTALHFRERLNNHFWSRENTIDINLFSKGDDKIKLYQYNKDGELIAEFPSITEGAKDLNIPRESIITAIRGNSLYKGDCYFSNTLYEKFIPKKKYKIKDLTYYIYDAEGKFINKFESYKDVVSYLGLSNSQALWNIVNRSNGIYKNYQFRYEYFDKIDPIPERKYLKKPVDIYTKNGEFIKTCPSIASAVKETGCHLSDINRILRGLAKSTKGYTFKFHEEIKDIV